MQTCDNRSNRSVKPVQKIFPPFQEDALRSPLPLALHLSSCPSDRPLPRPPGSRGGDRCQSTSSPWSPEGCPRGWVTVFDGRCVSKNQPSRRQNSGRTFSHTRNWCSPAHLTPEMVVVTAADPRTTHDADVSHGCKGVAAPSGLQRTGTQAEDNSPSQRKLASACAALLDQKERESHTNPKTHKLVRNTSFQSRFINAGTCITISAYGHEV